MLRSESYVNSRTAGDTVVDELPATRWRYAIAGSDTPTAGAAVDVAAGSITRVAIRTIGR